MAKTKRKRTSISQKRIVEQFKKSDCELIVVAFKNNRRNSTYAGLNIFEALHEIAKQTASDFNAYLVFNEPEGNKVSRNFEDWEPCIEDARLLYDMKLKTLR